MTETLRMAGWVSNPTLMMRALDWLRRYWRGEISRKFLVFFCVPVGSFFFVGGLTLSAVSFPDSYDWRYQVMCSLASPVKNPAGYLYWCFGIILTILMGVPTCGYFRSRFLGSSPRMAVCASIALSTGYVATIVVALETAFFPNYGGYLYKAHEITAIITLVGIYLGVAEFWYCLTVWLVKVRRFPRWFGVTVFLLPATPMTGIMISQAWLFFDPNRPGWVSREWIALGIPIWFSFAFWEWLAVCGLVFCICVLVCVLPAEPGGISRFRRSPLTRLSLDVAAGEKAVADH